MGFNLKDYANNKSNNRQNNETPSASAGGFSLIDYANRRKREEEQNAAPAADPRTRARSAYDGANFAQNKFTFTPAYTDTGSSNYSREDVLRILADNKIAQEQEQQRQARYDATSAKLENALTPPKAPMGIPTVGTENIIKNAEELAAERKNNARGVVGGADENGRYIIGTGSDRDLNELSAATGVPADELRGYADENRNRAYQQAYIRMAGGDITDTLDFMRNYKNYGYTDYEANQLLYATGNSLYGTLGEADTISRMEQAWENTKGQKKKDIYEELKYNYALRGEKARENADFNDVVNGVRSGETILGDRSRLVSHYINALLREDAKYGNTLLNRDSNPNLWDDAGYRNNDMYTAETNLAGMSDEDKATLLYLAYTDPDFADKWIRAKEDEWAQKVANDANINDAPILKKFAVAAGSGIDSFFQGVADLFSGKPRGENALQYQFAALREGTDSSITRGIYDIIQNTAHMAPSILLGKGLGLAAANLGASSEAVGQVSGLANALSVGTSAAGNAKAQALREGFSAGEATAYGLLNGASEALLEKFLASKFVGGGVWGNLEEAALKKIDNTLIRAAVRIGSEMGSEFTEEYLQEVLDPVFRNIVFNENNEFKLFTEEALYAGILGALSGGLMSAGASWATTLNEESVGKLVDLETLKQEALTYPGTQAEELAMAIGDNPSDARKGALANAVTDARIDAYTARADEIADDLGVSKRTLRKIAKGQTLSDADAQAVISDPKTSYAVEELTGLNFSGSDIVKGEWTANYAADGVKFALDAWYDTTVSPLSVSHPDVQAEKPVETAAIIQQTEPQVAPTATEAVVAPVEAERTTRITPENKNAKNEEITAPAETQMQTVNSENRRAWDALAAEYGEKGAEMMRGLFDDELDYRQLDAIARDFSAYYNAGVDGKGLMDVESAAKVEAFNVFDRDSDALTSMEIAAYEAGQQDAGLISAPEDAIINTTENEGGAEYGGEQGQSIRDGRGTVRGVVQRSGGQAGAVYGEQTQNTERRAGYVEGRGRQTAGGRYGVSQEARGQRVSSKELGLPTGTSSKNLTITTKTDSWGYRHALKAGAQYDSVAGEIEIDDGTERFPANGAQWREGTADRVLTRSDDPKYTEKQLSVHELTHLEIRTGRANLQKLANAVFDLAETDENVHEFMRPYVLKYGNIMSIAGWVEELIADTKANMDRFGVEGAKKAMDTLRRAFGKVYEQSRDNGERGAKYSRAEGTDSTGRELSAGQQEYFADSKARNSKGQLVLVYHGTRKADFNVFRRSINYFTDNAEVADSYAPSSERYEGYVNITRPFTVDAKGDKWSGIRIDAETKALLNKYGASTFKEGGAWRTSVADIASAVESMIEDGADYDGVIIENVDDTGSYYKNAPENVGTDYIAFNSQQFKRADNLNPTQDRDIRYSKAEDTEYLELAQEPEKNKAELQRMVDEAAEAAMPDSAIRDKDGKLQVVYHGSRAVFSVFDLAKTGKASTESKVGFWFTDKESFARAFANDIWYGDGDEVVVYDAYLNIRNPYIYTSTAISKEQSEQREREIKTANEKISQLGKKHDIDSFLGREEALSKNGRFWMMLRVRDLDSFETEYDAYAKMFGIEGTEAEKAQMRADVAEYQKLVEELKKLDERRIAETYTDAYENFRTSIYKYAGMDAEDANFGGLGKVLPDAENVIKRFVSDLKAEGYDGIVIRDTRYDKTYGGGDQFVAFDSEQIKSAEPVTYDDEGNVIPLSERFNSENVDIRYSEQAPSPQADAYAEMRRQLAEANRKLAEAREQLKKTPQPTVRKDDSRKLARDIIKRYGSNANVESISNAIENLGNLIVRGSDEQGDATVERVSEAAADIMYGIISTSDSVYDEDELALHKEIRDAIRSTPLYVSKYEKADVGDAYGSYNEFRKRNMGKLTTTNNAKAMRVDVFYQELCDRFPWAFDPNITNQADQIKEMLRVAESELKPTYNIAEESEAEATDLIFRIIGDVRQVETYADRAAKRLNLAIVHERNVAANARDRARAKVAKLEEQLREKNRKMNELRKQKNRVIEDIKLQHSLEKEQERERMQRREAEERLLKLVQRMNNTKLSKPNRAYFEQYFGDIYTIARSVTGQKLAQVADVEKRYKALSNPKSEYYDQNFIRSPRMEAYFAQYDKSTYIADMTDEQLGDYIYALLELDYMQREQNRLIKAADRSDVRMQAYNVIADVDFTRGVKENRASQFADWMIRDILGAVNTIRRYTGHNDYDPLYQRTLDLSRGEMDAAKYAIDSEAMFDPLLNNKKATRTFSGRNAEEIEITARAVVNGDKPVTLKITPAMRTALYMHLQNDDNMRHIADGGIVIPDVELLKKGKISDAYAKGTKVKFEKSELRKIVAGMSDFEIEFAKTAAKYFDDVSAKSISEVYEALHGVPPKMVGGKYFPIAVVPSATGNADVSAEQMLNAYEGGGAEIMNPGWLKERVSSKMPILLVPVDTVVNRAIQNHSRYVGLAIPLTNFNKVWNASLWGESKRYNSLTKTEETSAVPTISVKDAVADKWGAKAVNTINDFVDQISGRQRRTNASWFAKLRSNYAGAVLTMNPATALKQIPSGVAAAYIVGYKALGKAATPGLRADTSFIDDMTAAYTMRKKGYSSQELGELASNKRKLPKVLSWIVGADLATTKVLKRAAVFYVRDNFKTLQVGSEAYKQKVVDVYEQIINETQPTYDVSYRAAALRSNNEVKRALHMFKTQPYKNFGIVYTAFGEMFAKRKTYREANRYATDSEESKTYAEEAKKAYNEAKKGVARAVTSQAISAMMIASIVAAWDMFTGGKKKYKDEDGEVTFLSFLKGLGINFASTGAGAIPFGSTTLEYAEQAVDKIVGKDIFGTTAYEFSIPEVDMLNNLLTSVADLTEKVFGGKLNSTEKVARTVLKDAGDVLQAFGVPLKNVEKLTKAVLTNTFRASGKYVGEYKALRVMGTVDAYKQAHYDNLYKAYKNDKAQYQEIYNDLIDNGVTEKAIKDAMESRMKSEQGVSSVKELKSRYLSPTQQKEYDKTVAAVKQSSVYYESDSSDRARLSELAYEVVTTDRWKSYATVKDNNLNATEYILYQLALDIVDQPNSKGDYGTYTDAEKAAAVKMAKSN